MPKIKGQSGTRTCWNQIVFPEVGKDPESRSFVFLGYEECGNVNRSKGGSGKAEDAKQESEAQMSSGSRQEAK